MRRIRVLLIVVFASVKVGFTQQPTLVSVSADVTTRVVVRESPSSTSAAVGELKPGQQATLLGSVPNWYRVQLGGVTGFVSKRWTTVGTSAQSPSPIPAPEFTIDVIDVGTGLSVLVRGSDFSLLYDAGSNDDTARGTGNRVLAYLHAAAPSLTKIDHLLLSHPHKDHVELMPDVVMSYSVSDVWDSGRLNDICGYRAFATAVRDKPGVRYHTAMQEGGTRDYSFASKTCYGVPLSAEVVRVPHASRIEQAPIPLGTQASMTILHADGSPHSSVNENSLVVRLDLGSTRVLLMGDAEAGGRKSPIVLPTSDSIEGMLLTCCKSDVAANLLIVGHHGSKTSSRSAFLDAVGASITAVSAGPTKYSTVVLPDSEVVAELAARGQVFRTDLNDATCSTTAPKVGTVNDGQPGGCDNVRFSIRDGQINARYVRLPN